MKKKCIILFILTFILFIPSIYAANYINNVFNVDLITTENITEEENITVKININVSYELTTIKGSLKYDKEKLSLTECSSKKFICTYKDKFLLDSIEGIKGTEEIAILNFKVLDKFEAGEDAIIELNDVEGDNNTKGNNVKIKIHKIQTDSTLTSLSVENEKIEPAFSKNIYTYNIKTFSDKINILATAKSSISNVGIKKLSYGNNIFKIIVKAENQEETTYIINAFREKNIENQNVENNTKEKQSTTFKKKKNNNQKEKKLSTNTKLKYLIIDDKEIPLSDNLYEYNITIDSNNENIKIDYKTEDTKTKVIISGDTKLRNNDGIIYVSVLAEDGTRIDYKINILKKDKKNIVSFIDVNDKKIKLNKTSKKTNLLKFLLIIIFVVSFIIFIIFKKRKLRYEGIFRGKNYLK